MQMRMLVRCLPTSYAKAFVDEHDGAVAAEALAGVAAALASVPREAVELLKRHRLAKAVFSAAVQFACAISRCEWCHHGELVDSYLRYWSRPM